MADINSQELQDRFVILHSPQNQNSFVNFEFSVDLAFLFNLFKASFYRPKNAASSVSAWDTCGSNCWSIRWCRGMPYLWQFMFQQAERLKATKSCWKKLFNKAKPLHRKAQYLWTPRQVWSSERIWDCARVQDHNARNSFWVCGLLVMCRDQLIQRCPCFPSWFTSKGSKLWRQRWMRCQIQSETQNLSQIWY